MQEIRLDGYFPGPSGVNRRLDFRDVLDATNKPLAPRLAHFTHTHRVFRKIWGGFFHTWLHFLIQSAVGW